jgi:hypothetical protein
MNDAGNTHGAGIGSRIWALVPSPRRVPTPIRERVRSIASLVKARIREELDLPSREEVRAAMLRLDEVDKRINDLSRDHAAPQEPEATTVFANEDALRQIEEAGASIQQLKKDLRKDLKKKLKNYQVKKPKRSKKTTINVGSPKSMKDARAKAKSATPKEKGKAKSKAKNKAKNKAKK